MPSLFSSSCFSTLDTRFSRALQDFSENPLFTRTDDLYTDEEKRLLIEKWGVLRDIFIGLQKLLQKGFLRRLLGRESWNDFLIQYFLVATYYQYLSRLQMVFSTHEDFIRQCLDEKVSENYSTIARYMYRWRFWYFLHYPVEFLQLFRGHIAPDILWMLDHPREILLDRSRQMGFDWRNIWYYCSYRITLVITWLSTHIGMWISDIHFTDREHGFILLDRAIEYESRARPGDILLVRRNWEATNASIPGFWKHMAMYVGTGEYLKRIFKISQKQEVRGRKISSKGAYSSVSDGEVNFSNDEIRSFSEISREYQKMSQDLDPKTHYVIETVGTGVRLIPLRQFFTHYDYLSVLRTRFSGEKLSRVIQKAMIQLGVPYDFAFNFYSDKAFVCSTLVMKAYLSEYRGDEGLHIDLVRIATGITYPPNHLLTKFRRELSTDRQELDLVLFLDLVSARTGESRVGTLDEFSVSGDRSRWSFLQR